MGNTGGRESLDRERGVRLIFPLNPLIQFRSSIHFFEILHNLATFPFYNCQFQSTSTVSQMESTRNVEACSLWSPSTALR
jgi:hypothetical protein